MKGEIMMKLLRIIAVILLISFETTFIIGCSLKQGYRDVDELIDFVEENTNGDQQFVEAKKAIWNDHPMISIFFVNADMLDDKYEIISSFNSFFESNPDYYLIAEEYYIDLCFFYPDKSGSKACNYEMDNYYNMSVKDEPTDRLISLFLEKGFDFHSDCNGMFESIKYLQIPWSSIGDYSLFEHFPNLIQVVIKTNQNIDVMIEELRYIYPDVVFMNEEKYLEEMTQPR